MEKNRYLLLLLTVVTGSWLFGTILIDFFLVPSVFRIVNDFFNAGELGIRVFSIFNNVEVIFGMIVVIVCLRTKRLPIIALSVCLLLIALLYISFLSPSITEVTALWKASGDVIVNGKDYQQEHQHLHRIYIWVDSVKLLFLSILLGLGFFKQEWFE